jgi:hypothetical protein
MKDLNFQFKSDLLKIRAVARVGREQEKWRESKMH